VNDRVQRIDRPRDWRREALDLVANRLSDARAHTEAGRLAVGLARVEELGGALAELLGNARAAYYYSAFAAQRPLLDPAIHRLDLSPNKEGELWARLTPIAGRDQALVLAGLIGEAGSMLEHTDAAERQSDPATRADAFEEWEDTQRDELQQFMRAALSAAEVALREVIRRLHVRPELQ